MKDRVRDGGGIGLERFENQEESFVVGCGEGSESGDFLEGLVVFDIGEFESSDKGGETFGAEAVSFVN